MCVRRPLVRWAVPLSMLALLLAVSSSRAASDAIVTEAVVAGSVEDVWKAWTTTEGMESWMVARADVDLRIGGLWRTSYARDADLDGDTAIHHRILALDPLRMLAFQTVKTPRAFPFRAILQTWTVVYLDPLDTTHTKVTVRMLGYTDDAEGQKMRAFFESGNKATLDALVKRFD